MLVAKNCFSISSIGLHKTRDVIYLLSGMYHMNFKLQAALIVIRTRPQNFSLHRVSNMLRQCCLRYTMPEKNTPLEFTELYLISFIWAYYAASHFIVDFGLSDISDFVIFAAVKTWII